MSSPELKAAVGLSRKWDAREAGRELVNKTLERLEGAKPNFFLLFPTIHYANHGGFKELLNGVWDVLPKKTPLVGGTVMGFINNMGCFTRGVTGLAVSYPNMDVAVGVGHNTKRSPATAAKSCVELIKNGLKNSKYKNKFLFDMISGTEIPSMPGMGRKAVIPSDLMGKFATKMLGVSEVILQKGFGNEEEILEEMLNELDDYSIIHGSSLDVSLAKNYQFLGDKVLTDSIVSLGVSSDLNVNLSFASRANLTKKFKVTKISKDRRVIHEIDGKPASEKLLELVGWKGKFPTDRQFTFGITTYFPICFISDGKNFLRPVVGILGGSILLMSKFESNEGYVALISGKNMIDSLDDILTDEMAADFGILSSCAVRLMGLGGEVFAIREKLMKYFKDKPFILVNCAGEAVRKPNDRIYYLNESIALGLIGR